MPSGISTRFAVEGSLRRGMISTYKFEGSWEDTVDRVSPSDSEDSLEFLLKFGILDEARN